MEKQYKGLILLLSAEFFWGIAATFGKFVYSATTKIDPFTLIQIRLTFSTLIFCSLFYLQDKELFRINRRQIPYLLGYGLGIAVMQFTLYYSISLTNVGIGCFLQSFSAVIVSLYCIIFGHQKLGAFRTMALAVGFLGLFVMLYNQFYVLPSVQIWGIIIGLVSAIGQTLYVLFGKNGLRITKPQTMLIYGYIFAAFISWLIVPPSVVINKGFNLTECGYCFIFVVFGAVVPYYLNLRGINLSTTSTAGIVTIFNPVVSAVSAYFCLGEVLTMMEIVGVFLISLGIIFLQVEVKRDVKQQSVLQQ